MATLTIADLDNGKRDLETVDAVANSQADTTTTRYGQQTLTLAGALRRLGYQAPVPYAAGLTVTSGLTTVERSGVIYAPRVELLPFTTAAWSPEQWRVVQDDPNLRNDLASSSGARMIGFGQRTVEAALSDAKTILDFGGNPDGVTDNAAAVLAMHAAGLPLRFPFVPGSANSYRITGAMEYYSLQNAWFDVAEGVSIGLDSIAALHWTNKFIRATRVLGVQFSDETIIPSHYEGHVSDKPLWLGAADIDHTLSDLVPFDSSTLSYRKSVLGSDLWTDSAMSASTPFVAATLAPATYDAMESVFSRLRAGSEISATFTGAANVQIGVTVRHAAGSVSVVADAVNFIHPTVLIKPLDSPLTFYGIDYPGRAVNAAYSAKNSIWGVRRTGRGTFTVMLNGQPILRNFKCEGDIAEVGFSARSLSASGGTVIVNNVIRERFKKSTGGGAIRVGCYGDSITSDIFVGSWPRWVSKFLDGSAGVRCINLKNYAVSGASSAQMYTTVSNATDLATLDYAFVMIGVNDVQGGVSWETYYNNLAGIVLKLQAANVRVVLGIPSMFYSRALAGGSHGQDTANYANGALIRSVAQRVAGSTGCKLVDILGDMGTIQPQFLDPARTDDPFGPYVGDPVLADNIHPTGYGHILIARAFAEAALGDIHFRGTEEVSTPESAFIRHSSGWTNNASYPPKWVRSESGVVTLSGLLDKGSGITDGAVIGLLPLHLRPLNDQRVVSFNGSPTPHTTTISSNGEIRIYGYPATGGSYSGIDGITYQT